MIKSCLSFSQTFDSALEFELYILTSCTNQCWWLTDEFRAHACFSTLKISNEDTVKFPKGKKAIQMVITGIKLEILKKLSYK